MSQQLESPTSNEFRFPNSSSSFATDSDRFTVNFGSRGGDWGVEPTEEDIEEYLQNGGLLEQTFHIENEAAAQPSGAEDVLFHRASIQVSSKKKRFRQMSQQYFLGGCTSFTFRD